jgi:hypothetical protein
VVHNGFSNVVPLGSAVRKLVVTLVGLSVNVEYL